MLAIKRIFGWLGGKAILFVLIVLAILASTFVVPWLKTQWNEPGRRLSIAQRLDTVKGQLEEERAAAERRLAGAAVEARTKGIGEIDRALADARQAKALAERHRRSGRAQLDSLLTADADALLGDRLRELEIQYRDREIAGLSAARDHLIKGDVLAAFPVDLDAKLGRATAETSAAWRSCGAADQALKAFEARWQVRATWGLYERERHLKLQGERSSCWDSWRRLDETRRRLEDQRRLRDAAAQAYRQTRAWTDAGIQSVTRDIEVRIAKERAAANGSWRQKLSLWAERNHLAAVLRQAALALVLIVATPYLIRLFCYFVLAPAAMRRPEIRFLTVQGAEAAIPSADRSATSVGVRLAAGEELLVRNGYLQTTSDAGGKGTQWFLDVRHPITSVVTGLTFLTRIRGEGEMTTVSAVRDPLAEVTVLTLPDGAACVLQPRALAAVGQPIDRPLRVTTHWRLWSLNAWLTLQLRYFVFHGPARLVLKGGRGVRVERAERGRILGQEQVVGFSPDLAYSVTRNETFWPYFLGREPLLRDRVAAGGGVLVVEEAPLASRRPSEVPHGIEGLIDAGLKVFGW